MSVVELSVRMRSAAVMSAGEAARVEGELAIRLKPLRPGCFNSSCHPKRGVAF